MKCQILLAMPSGKQCVQWKRVIDQTQVFSFFLAVLGLHCCMGFSLLVARGTTLELRCVGFSLQRLLWFRSTGSVVPGLQKLQHMSSAAAALRL